MNQRNQYIVPLSCAGQRLDKAAAELSQFSRSQIQQLIEQKTLFVNGISRSSSYIVKAEDRLELELKERQPTHLIPEPIPLEVIYADTDIIVINKSAGTVVHPGAGNWTGTLVHALLYHFPDMSIKNEERPGIVHRLDKDTSGIMVCARNDVALQALTHAFKNREVHKIYHAFCVGTFKDRQLELVTGHGRHPKDRKRFTTRLSPELTTEGSRVRLAHSRFQILGENGGISELLVELLTGRTHQIRAHLSDIHKPLVQDSLYGGDKALERLPKSLVKTAALSLKRQALHAEKIAFSHPRTAKKMEFSAPLPHDLKTLQMVLREGFK